MVRRSTAQDKNLPARALGVLIYLMSKPSDWEPTIIDICNRFPDIGKNQAYRIISEVFIPLGYARRVPERKNGKIIRWVTEIYEEPVLDFVEVENPQNQTEPVPDFGEVESLPQSQSKIPAGGLVFPQNRENSQNFLLPQNRELVSIHVQNTDIQNTEQQQAAENREIAAAANPFNDAHSSRFSFPLIETYVAMTKPHIRNPGGLARKIWRSGEEDALIEQWREKEEKPKVKEMIWPKWVFEGDVEHNKRMHLQLIENQRRIEAEIQQDAANDAA